MARQLRDRVRQIKTAFNEPIHDGELRNESRIEATRVLTARALSVESALNASSRLPFLTSVRWAQGHAREIRAFQLSFADDSGHVAFETIAGIRTYTPAEPAAFQMRKRNAV